MVKSKKQQGFIYIDVLVGVIILTIALIAFAVAYQHSARGTATASQSTIATHMAMEAIENLKRNEGGGFVRTAAEWQTTGAKTINHIPYQITTSVIPDGNLTSTQIAANLRIIPVQVTVTWPEGHITMTAYYRQYLNPILN